MYLINNVEEVNQLIEKTKNNASRFITNFFINQDRLKRWIKTKKLKFIESKNVVLFFREDRNFSHLYFLATDCMSLAEIMESVKVDNCVVDLINHDIPDEIVNIFVMQGFNHHATLHRMIRKGNHNYECNILEVTDEVEYAGLQDLDSIIVLLENEFDIYAEDIPENIEIAELIYRKSILIIREERKIAALLIFENVGVTSHLRYWLVCPDFRGYGFGQKILSNYLGINSHITRFILWVKETNIVAQKIYSKYGYTHEKLKDFIIKK